MLSSRSEARRKLGERFQSARLERGVTQMELANLAGMNVSNYGKIERGVNNPSFETVIRLAGVLGVDPGELVTGIGIDDLPPARTAFTAADYVREREAREREARARR